MDAFQLTRPILSDARRISVDAPRRLAVPPTDLLVSARRYVNQLPLGAWSGPPFDGPRWNPRAAAREVERALFRAAASSGVAVSVDDSPAAIARRLVQCRVIVAPAADGAIALLELLGLEEGSGDAAKLAERLIGYLDHRATSGRSARRSIGHTRSVWPSESDGQTLRDGRTVRETLR